MPGFLLDTNHLGETLNPISVVRERIYQKRREGIKVGTCVPVLRELEIEIRQLLRPDQSRRELATLMNQVRLWPIDQIIVANYGENLSGSSPPRESAFPGRYHADVSGKSHEIDDPHDRPRL